MPPDCYSLLFVSIDGPYATYTMLWLHVPKLKCSDYTFWVTPLQLLLQEVFIRIQLQEGKKKIQGGTSLFNMLRYPAIFGNSTHCQVIQIWGIQWIMLQSTFWAMYSVICRGIKKFKVTFPTLAVFNKLKLQQHADWQCMLGFCNALLFTVLPLHLE